MRLSGVQLQQSLDAQTPGPSLTAAMGSLLNGLTTQSLHYGGDNPHEAIPEWAILLESSLQLILGQVAQVDAEVDAVKHRVNQHMESVDAKLVDLERRLVVGDALREIARTKTSRSLFKRDSAEATNGHTPEGSGGPGVIAALASAAAVAAAAANGSTSNGNTGTGSVALPRFRRMASGGTVASSGSSRRPSVQNFVTQKDLDEFHNGDTLNG